MSDKKETIYVRNGSKVQLRAKIWLADGDHAAVVPYKDKALPETNVCLKCRKFMRAHGFVEKPSGSFSVCPGDYIITDPGGNVSNSRPDLFRVMYQPTNA